MTRENAKELLPIIQAYAEGKVIQMKSYDGTWIDDSDNLDFYNNVSAYRIKPEEEYRPYKDCNEMIADFVKRFNTNVPSYAMPLIWVKKKTNKDSFLITGIDNSNDEYLAEVSGTWRKASDLFEDFTYLDGTPCGVKE